MYLALVASGGVFAFVWILLLMRDLNHLEQKAVFPVKLYAQIIVVGVLIFFLAVFVTTISMGDLAWWRIILIALTAVLGIALNLFLFISLVRVSKHITKALGYSHHTAHALAMIFLMFVYFVSFIILQRRMNTLIELRTQAGTTGELLK